MLKDLATDKMPPLDIPRNRTTLKLASVDVSAVDGIGQKQKFVSEVGQW